MKYPRSSGSLFPNPGTFALFWLLLAPIVRAQVQPDAPTQSRSASAEHVSWATANGFHERTAWLSLDKGVKVHLNAPASLNRETRTNVLLIFYALPNGNSIEQTVGRALKPGDDFRFAIQHIGAQTRFLRATLPGCTIVVAYLENDLKSWPAWRKKFGDQPIPGILETIKRLVPANQLEVVLAGHSGGGSLIFGYINTLESIPREVVRIAFLDANYAYETSRHQRKLASWLRDRDDHCLCVLAYNDAVALLQGKTFVSAEGGTWGKSHQMQSDLAQQFSFTCQTNAGFEHFSALEGRMKFILKENPDRKVLHTVLVERNGFIHSMLTGTPAENRGYRYFEKSYTDWIDPDPP